MSKGKNAVRQPDAGLVAARRWLGPNWQPQLGSLRSPQNQRATRSSADGDAMRVKQGIGAWPSADESKHHR